MFLDIDSLDSSQAAVEDSIPQKPKKEKYQLKRQEEPQRLSRKAASYSIDSLKSDDLGVGESLYNIESSNSFSKDALMTPSLGDMVLSFKLLITAKVRPLKK